MSDNEKLELIEQKLQALHDQVDVSRKELDQVNKLIADSQKDLADFQTHLDRINTLFDRGKQIIGAVVIASLILGYFGYSDWIPAIAKTSIKDEFKAQVRSDANDAAISETRRVITPALIRTHLSDAYDARHMHALLNDVFTWGYVNRDGQVTRGSGDFTCEKTPGTTGRYRIVFTDPPDTYTVIGVSPIIDPVGARVTSLDPNAFNIGTYDTTDHLSKDGQFTFIAIRE